MDFGHYKELQNRNHGLGAGHASRALRTMSDRRALSTKVPLDLEADLTFWTWIQTGRPSKGPRQKGQVGSMGSISKNKKQLFFVLGGPKRLAGAQQGMRNGMTPRKTIPYRWLPRRNQSLLRLLSAPVLKVYLLVI